MEIFSDIFDGFYIFLVIIFLIVSVISNILKKRMKDTIKPTQKDQEDIEYYPEEEAEKSETEYDNYKVRKDEYKAEKKPDFFESKIKDIYNKLQEKISTLDQQKHKQYEEENRINRSYEQAPVSLETTEKLVDDSISKLQAIEQYKRETNLNGFEKINELPYLQRAVVLSEVFGKPKGLEE